MKVAVIPNLTREYALKTTDEVVLQLKNHGAEIVLADYAAEEFSDEKIVFAPVEEAIKNCDVVIAIGGDGTVLHSGKIAAQYKKPILGICLGHQTIGHVFGGNVVKALKPVHGKVHSINHSNKGVFKNDL